jgi:hypothetical protein
MSCEDGKETSLYVYSIYVHENNFILNWFLPDVLVLEGGNFSTEMCWCFLYLFMWLAERSSVGDLPAPLSRHQGPVPDILAHYSGYKMCASPCDPHRISRASCDVKINARIPEVLMAKVISKRSFNCYTEFIYKYLIIISAHNIHINSHRNVIHTVTYDDRSVKNCISHLRHNCHAAVPTT